MNLLTGNRWKLSKPPLHPKVVMEGCRSYGVMYISDPSGLGLTIQRGMCRLMVTGRSFSIVTAPAMPGLQFGCTNGSVMTMMIATGCRLTKTERGSGKAEGVGTEQPLAQNAESEGQ